MRETRKAITSTGNRDAAVIVMLLKHVGRGFLDFVIYLAIVTKKKINEIQ